MAHIFISYSRNERDTAAQLAQRLTEEGYDVWWDAALLGGTRFEDEITHVLKEARVAIILWSKNAAASDWVRAEAEIARHRKSALPVVIDDVDIAALPILFQQIHIVELRNWNGSPDTAGYQQILKAVTERLGKQSDKDPADTVTAPPRRSTADAEARISKVADEQAAWAELSQAPDATYDDYADFLSHFPDGQFANIARMRVNRLGRRSGKRRRTVGLLVAAIVVLAIVALFGLRPVRDFVLQWMPGRVLVATCKGGESLVQAAGLVPMSFCTDSKLWLKSPTPASAGSALFFNSSDGMTLMASLQASVVDPETAKSYIIVSSDPAGKATLTNQTMRTVNGRQWSVWEWTWSNATIWANYLTYYTSSADIGSAAFTVYGKETESSLSRYGEPILQSFVFGQPGQ